MSLYLTNHWLIADQRFRLGFAVAVPCVVLALAWRTIASKDPPQDPSSNEKHPAKAQGPPTKSATNTKFTMRVPHRLATANKPNQAPAVPPKAAVRATRSRRTVPEKKSESVVQAEEERPMTPATPTSRPKRKSTRTEEPTYPWQADHRQGYHHDHDHQQYQQHSGQEPDSFSIGSGESSEPQSSSSNYKNKTIRMGKNLKRAWSKRPFAGNGNGPAAHAHGEESILFPESLGFSSPTHT